MLNCSMPVTTKNVQVLAPKSHLILQLKKKKKSQKGHLKQKFALSFIIYTFYIGISSENFISCIMTLEYRIRHKFLSL